MQPAREYRFERRQTYKMLNGVTCVAWRCCVPYRSIRCRRCLSIDSTSRLKKDYVKPPGYHVFYWQGIERKWRPCCCLHPLEGEGRKGETKNERKKESVMPLASWREEKEMMRKKEEEEEKKNDTREFPFHFNTHSTFLCASLFQVTPGAIVTSQPH